MVWYMQKGEVETEVFFKNSETFKKKKNKTVIFDWKWQRNVAVFQDLGVEIQEEGPPEASANIMHGIMENS